MSAVRKKANAELVVVDPVILKRRKKRRSMPRTLASLLKPTKLQAIISSRNSSVWKTRSQRSTKYTLQLQTTLSDTFEVAQLEPLFTIGRAVTLFPSRDMSRGLQSFLESHDPSTDSYYTGTDRQLFRFPLVNFKTQ